MVDMELPPEIRELVDSCDDNCREVEDRALDTLCSVELPVFSFLRDLSAQKCYFILCHLRDWFGSAPTKHHCLCLMTVTDYISCSYNHTNFYGTFVKRKQEKFYETFFLKLSKEWKRLFHRLPVDVLSLDQFISLKNSLHVSIARFSREFAFKELLSEIMTSCDECRSTLEKHSLNLKAKQNFKFNIDILNNLSPELPTNSSTVVRITNDSKSMSIRVPYKVVHTPTTPNDIRNLIKKQQGKRNSLPPQLIQPKQIDFSAASSKEIKPPPVIVIGDSPMGMDKTSSTLDNITNVVSSKAIKRPVEPIVNPLNLDRKLMKYQNGVAISNDTSKDSSQKKLNAFDILMRRKTVKTIS